MTRDEIRSALSCSKLTEPERLIFRKYYVQRLRAKAIADELGITRGMVRSYLSRARVKSFGRIKETPVKQMHQDAGWFQRQVDYLRQLADDPEHQGRYLRGIAICWGEEERKRVEEAI